VSTTLALQVCETDGQVTSIAVPIERVILVGYSGRDRVAVLEHIRELETLGVAPPERVPAMYPVTPDLVTTGSRLAVDAPRTSGEAEFVILPSPAGYLVGVGSDHTDRERETIDVLASKAACGKVIGNEVWRLDAVQAHWDTLELRAWSTDARGRVLYQEGRLGALLNPDQLLAEVAGACGDATATLIFSGTVATIGGFAYGSRFEVELRDGVLDRELRCAYDVVVR
jgi:hypothetical protein